MIISVLGFTIVAIVLFDVFQTIVVPRTTTKKFRIAPFLASIILWPTFKMLCNLPIIKVRQNMLLETFAPLAFIVIMLTWLDILMLGFACIFWDLRHSITPHIHSFFDAFYFAGTSVLTLGFGDYTASSWRARCVVLSAATSGLVFLALAVSYLFSLQSLVQQREQTVNLMISRAGAPASGLVLLLRYKELDILPTLYSNYMNWESWIAGILESHRAFPLLLFFRSSTNLDSWLSVLGALLDASSLMVTSVLEVSIGEAEMFYWIGCSTVKALCLHIGTEIETEEQLSYSDFADGLQLLQAAGYKVRDAEHAWKRFKVRRSGYQPYIRSLCKHLLAPSQTWIHELAISQITVKDSIKNSVFQA